ncbi:MAG: hypothetical protein H0W87_07875, partial [Actinobacteria bacterium]|nr:hypothetical protein [Actinomycetota bacterium]
MRLCRVLVPASVHRTFLIALLASTVLVAVACGGGKSGSGSPEETPGLFMSSLIRQKATGQYDLAWKSLHPLHQQVAPEKTYVHCENQTVFPGRLIKVSVVRVKDEPVRIAGEKKSVASKAVTLRVSVNSPGIPKPVVVKDTYHAIAVDGHWTWILTADNFAEYKAGH